MQELNDFSSKIQYIQKGNLLINTAAQEYLHTLGFDSFKAIWDRDDGQIIKNIKPRSVHRISVSDQDTESIFYLKKHKRQFIGIRGILQRCTGKKWISQGPLEFQNLCAFRRNVLKTASPLVAGEKFHRIFWVQSFLITKDFSPYRSLESIIRYHPDYFNLSKGKECKDNLIHEIAALAKRMHASGYHHRDFNATHILLHCAHNLKKPDLALFDLQRVEEKKIPSYRWMIKGLARLNYSLNHPAFDLQDKIKLFLAYRGKETFGILDRFLWLWIQRKEARIRRHTEKNRLKQCPMKD